MPANYNIFQARHMKHIAKTIRNMQEYDIKKQDIINEFSKMLLYHNPKFNPDWFNFACRHNFEGAVENCPQNPKD